MNRGVVNFYYTRNIPPRAVAIAEVRTLPATPGDLTDINNTPYLPGSLGIWRASGEIAVDPDFLAADLMVPVPISGSTLYQIDNQFFELTDKASGDGTPLFYFHPLPSEVTDVRVLDAAGNVVDVPVLFQNNCLYHSLEGAPYRVRYVDSFNWVHVKLLRYDPVLRAVPFSPSDVGYVLGGRTLQVAGLGTYYLRFTARNGYQLLPAYNQPPNAPWFPRIRFALRPHAPEWARQVFLPQRPYALGSWIPGKVIDKTLVEFDRKHIYYDPRHLPDILIYDKDHQLKYALEGAASGTPRRRGTLFNWKRGQIKEDVDVTNARVDLAVELEPDDIVYGFYSYREPDVIYRDLDVNPFTNPVVRNRTIEFYFKSDGVDPFRVIYHQVLNADGSAMVGQTNDPDPAVGTKHVFSEMVVGSAVSPTQFTVTDIRKRGGGLDERYLGIPEAANFWDIGYWDGKPYPIGGALVVYLPSTILERMSKGEVEGKVLAAVPMGVEPVIRYFDPLTGEESI